jgi:hypothetical protein
MPYLVAITLLSHLLHREKTRGCQATYRAPGEFPRWVVDNERGGCDLSAFFLLGEEERGADASVSRLWPTLQKPPVLFKAM